MHIYLLICILYGHTQVCKLESFSVINLGPSSARFIDSLSVIHAYNTLLAGHCVSLNDPLCLIFGLANSHVYGEAIVIRAAVLAPIGIGRSP